MSSYYHKDNTSELYSNSKDRVTIINNVKYPWRKEMKGNSMTNINGKVFIDGFELINGKWKRTLRGLYHLFF